MAANERNGVKSMALAALLEEFLDNGCDTSTAMDSLNMYVASDVVVLGTLLASKEENGEPVRIMRYLEEVVPRYSDAEFKSHFRMNRSTFEEVYAEIGQKLTDRGVKAEKKILSTLWVLSNQESYRGVADRFDLSKGSLHRITMEVCQALVDVRNKFICWPQMGEMTDIANGFSQRCGFPGVIGAIDGTHIAIPGPSTHRDAFINRKGFPSMVLQVVCDDKLRFLDVCTGWPGAVHDARLFKNSALRGILERGGIPPEYHLLGDSAYPLTPYLLVPFRDNGHMSEVEKNYNRKHSSTRVEVERSIGLLKGKFRRLKYLHMLKQTDIPVVIVAACVLHNIILNYETIDFDLAEEYHNMEVNNIAPNDVAPVNNAGARKRTELAHALY